MVPELTEQAVLNAMLESSGGSSQHDPDSTRPDLLSVKEFPSPAQNSISFPP